MNNKSIGEFIHNRRREKHLTQDQLAELASLNRVTIAKYESGRVEPGAQALIRIAKALEISVDQLVGLDPEEYSPFIPIVRDAVPVIGTIAGGTPIMAEENYDGYVSLPAGVQADFALKCSGDSMSPTFEDGDYVLIKQKPEVNGGKIAAVLIGTDATLKRIHHLPDGLLLNPDNQSSHSPILLREEQACEVRIIGEAVGYVRNL